MRVVLVVQQLRRAAPAGIGTYTRGLLRGLRALDSEGGALEVPEIVLHASRPAARPDPLGSFGYPVVASPWPGPLLTRAWDRGWAGAPAFDVLHATSLAMPPVRDGAAAVTVHDLFWRELPDAFPPRGRRWHEGAYRRALERCRLVVVPAAEIAAAVEADVPPGVRVEVVPEGADHLVPPDNAAASAVLSQLGVDGPFLLSVSTVEPRKNLRRLLTGYRIARSRLVDPPPLVVVGFRGWGGEHDAIAGEGVVAAGAVSDPVLSSFLHRALGVVYVPLREGFGLPAVEAMAAGAPVVASPMPSTGGAAVEVDPLDETSIADALERVVTDDDLRTKLIAAGARRAGGLTWEAAARRHVELWDSIR